MSLSFKILSRARNIFLYVILYLVCTTVSVFFNVVNLAIFIPILKIIFGQVNILEIVKPSFAFSIEYLKDLFQYYFQSIIAEHGNLIALYFVGTILIISVFISSIFRYFSNAIIVKIKIYIVSQFRISIFDRVSSLGMRYFTTDNKNNILTNIASDIQIIENSVEDIFKACFKEPITICGYLVAMYHISDRFTMLAGIFLPIIGILITCLIRILRRNANKTQQTLVSIIDTMENMLANIPILKIFDAQDFFKSKFENENNLYKKYALSMDYKKSFLPPLSEFLGMAVVTFVLMFGGTQILKNQIILSPSVFITYILIFSYSIVPIKNVTRSVGNVQRCFSAAERIFNFLKRPNTKDINQTTHLTEIKDGIKIHNLSFDYEEGKDILKSINMEIKKGEKIILTGKSGSGKSTLLNILAGVEQNYKGEIFIDGKELREYDKRDWYKIIGFCSQKQFIIHDTVLNNLTLGKDIELSKIINLSMALQTHDFISTMKNGYNTVLTKDNNFLSGGQVKRLCLLRTLLKDPDFLILDEPTSSLDSETENKIIDVLLNTDKTIIMISHNIENFKCFDKIYSIDNGLCVKL